MKVNVWLYARTLQVADGVGVWKSHRFRVFRGVALARIRWLAPGHVGACQRLELNPLFARGLKSAQSVVGDLRWAPCTDE